MPQLRTYSQQALDDLVNKSRGNQRLRQNLNIHPGDASRCHRLFNAVEPGSYIRPHRHLDPEKSETFLPVRGSLGIVLFADDGSVTETVLLTPEGEIAAVDIPCGRFHTAVSLAPGTIFFETKAGPYLPLAEAELAPWAPVDGSPDATLYLHRLTLLFQP